jgi:Flp pilus assembly pilin Flp
MEFRLICREPAKLDLQPALLRVLDRKNQVEESVAPFLQQLWSDEQGQDIAEYAVMLAVILVIVVGTIRLIGGNANNVFSSVSSSIQ